MKYKKVKKALFLKRSNRFIAHVLLDGREEVVHVKNTGRCREILLYGTTVILEEALKPGTRKTRYSLIGSYKGDRLINIDSQVPNHVVFEALKQKKIKGFENVSLIKREVTYGRSRFDLYFEKGREKGFIEVKGVTLEREGLVMFPDAPTERGTKHVLELAHAVAEGYKGFVIFLIQMKGVDYFIPNRETDEAFSKALALAKEKGVTLLAYDARVMEDEITIGSEVEIRL